MHRRYLVSGKVQGVGFRNYVQKKARQLELDGWVRNLADGRVEAQAMGEDSAIEHFEIFVRRGPMLAEVVDVEVFDEVDQANEKSDFAGTGFNIRESC